MRYCLVLGLVLSASFYPAKGDETIPASDLQILLEALRQKYRTFSCDYSVECDDKSQAWSGRYYQKADGLYRGSAISPSFDLDAIVRSGTLSNYSRRDKSMTVRPDLAEWGPKAGIGLANVWNMIGMELPNSKDQVVYVGDLFEDRWKGARCRRLASGDIELKEVTGDEYTIHQFSKAHNYLLVARRMFERVSDKMISELKVMEFGQSNGEQFALAARRWEDHPYGWETTGFIQLETKYKFGKLVINEPIADTVFIRTCKPGTVVVDSLLQRVDVIADDGSRKQDPERTFVDPKRQINLPPTAQSNTVHAQSPVSSWLFWLTIVLAAVDFVLGYRVARILYTRRAKS